MLEYANSIGLIWYSKYQLRVLKHIKNLVKDHSFSTLATFLIGNATSHNNVINSIPFVTKDVSAIWGNPFSNFAQSVGQILPIHAVDTILPK
jgi:hypothetical protein